MHRFYCPNSDFTPARISIVNPGEIHHLTRVLRLSKGDKVDIFNGLGEEITGIIEQLSAIEVQISVLERRSQKRTSAFITLACAVPKKAKFEWIIEKCTELGVDEIVPLRTQRTEVIIKEERMQRKSSRYQTVAINAAKQSARTTVPIVQPQRLLKEFVASYDQSAMRIIFALDGHCKTFKEVLGESRKFERIVLMVGPEGDFTKQELDLSISQGFTPVTLGETILKVDTAAVMAVGFTRLYYEV